MTRLTPQELEAIRKRTKKATSGNRLTDMGAFEASAIVLTEDIPKLLAEVERLQLQVDRMVSSAYEYLDTSTHTYMVAEEIEREDA